MASGYAKLPSKAGILPDLRVDALGEYFGGVPGILKSDVKRREAKAHQVGSAEIADQAA